MGKKGFYTIRRSDANQTEIVKRFREWGCTVLDIHAVGHGAPDVVVGEGGKNYLIEIKDGAKPPSERRLTEDEKKWHADWRGSVQIVETIDDVDALVQWWKAWKSEKDGE